MIYNLDSIIMIEHRENKAQLCFSYGTYHNSIVPYYSLIKDTTDNFVRITSTCIINIQYCVKFNNNSLTLITGDRVAVDGKYIKDVTNKFFKMKLNNFIKE